jgi:glycosyltransferase involved in cell wall biosynthesis
LTSALLIADGLIATTDILERLLREAYGSVQVVTAETLHGVEVKNRPLFISRLCHPRYRWLPDYLREQNCNYVYFLDDNFFELTTDYDVFNGAFFSHPAVHDSLTHYLRAAARVWLMSAPLEHYLHERLPDLRTQFISAPVDINLFDRIAAIEGIALKKSAQLPFVVGYPSTRRENVSSLVAEVVTRASKRWGDSIRFEFIGWCPDAISAHPSVTVFPATKDYTSFLQLLFSRNWDAAIAPLGSSLFENSKTSLKYREYGAARLPAVYSNCALFAACVTQGVNGLLAGDDPDDWLMQIAALKDDHAFRARIVNNARTDVEAKHRQSIIAKQMRELFAPVWGGA